jgi:hypothetical protein
LLLRNVYHVPYSYKRRNQMKFGLPCRSKAHIHHLWSTRLENRICYLGNYIHMPEICTFALEFWGIQTFYHSIRCFHSIWGVYTYFRHVNIISQVTNQIFLTCRLQVMNVSLASTREAKFHLIPSFIRVGNMVYVS